MDKRNYKYDKIGSPSIEEVPSIVVEGPSYDKLPYVDVEMGNPDEEGDRVGDMVHRCQGEDEKKDNIRELGRRNSISLPNLGDIKVFSENINEVSICFITEEFGRSYNPCSMRALVQKFYISCCLNCLFLLLQL